MAIITRQPPKVSPRLRILFMHESIRANNTGPE